jgi:hypothetical protein
VVGVHRWLPLFSLNEGFTRARGRDQVPTATSRCVLTFMTRWASLRRQRAWSPA